MGHTDMKIIKVVNWLVFTVVLAALSVSCATQEVDTCASCSTYLSAGELEELQEKTMSGDKEAAERVALHYSTWSDDDRAAIYWVEISARMGSVSSQLNAAYLLMRKGPFQNCNAARMWLEKAASTGSELALDRLQGFTETCK